MVGVSTFILFGLSLLRLGVAAQATTETPTLEDVDTQLSTYLKLLENGTVSARGTPARSVTLPSGCELAVRKTLHNHDDANAESTIIVRFPWLLAEGPDILSRKSRVSIWRVSVLVRPTGF